MKNKYLLLLVSFLVKHKDDLTLSQSCRTLFMHPFNFWKFPGTKSEVSDLRTLLWFFLQASFSLSCILMSTSYIREQMEMFVVDSVISHGEVIFLVENTCHLKGGFLV